MGTVLGFHLQQVSAIEPGLTFGHLIEWVAHKNGRECTLSRTIRSHNGMCLSVVDNEVDALQYLFLANASV